MCALERKKSEGNVYHIIVRGTGRQLIFEDDEDRALFVKRLSETCAEQGGVILAWCLMANHVHLLLQRDIEVISACMQRIEASYAKYFNKRYDRAGALFQGRFTSVPIEGDEQLLTTVRYIHQNPVKIGQPYDNPWSSYREYLSEPSIANTEFILSIFGSARAFAEFHGSRGSRPSDIPRSRLTDAQAKEAIVRILGDISPYELRCMEQLRRDALLRSMKREGVTIRQIERNTSIGRSIIARA